MNLPAKRHLDTTNPEHILYQHDLIEIAILGGIRTDMLDRMRVTLKIQVEHLAKRHTLDLYNSYAVEKLVRMVAEKLEIGTSIIAAALDDLTDLLEAHRLGEREKELSSQHEKRVMLTEEEIKTHKLYLSSPNLIGRTNEDLGRCGIIGEELNRLLMFLIFLTRKMQNPLHIISLGSSGAGKTHLQERVSLLVPEEDKLEITTLSENAFYYFERRALANKLILIEDLDGAEGVMYPLREIKSKKRITKTVVIKNTKGETRTVSLIVEGPVCISGCTTRQSVYEDNANRSFLIYIDETPEQDEKIMDYQRKLAAGKIDLNEEEKIREQFRNIQRVLVPVTIRNPFAEYLKIPNEVFKPRRTNAHYLAFIEAVTFYHQYQRERQYDKETRHGGQAGEEYIEVTIEDIREANKLMKEVLLRKSDELTGACRDYFERLKQWLKESDKSVFTNKEARQSLREKPSNQKKFMVQLQMYGHVRKGKGDQKNGYCYEVASITDYQELKDRIATVLDEIVEKLECLHAGGMRFSGSEAVQASKEPLNGKKTSKLAQAVTKNAKGQPADNRQ